MLKVAMLGATGRMGRSIVPLILESEDLRLSGALAAASDPAQGRDAGLLAGTVAAGVNVSSDAVAALRGANVAIDFIRSRQSRETTQNSSLRLIKTSDEPEQGREFQHKEIVEVFEQDSRALSPKQKTIFVMHAMEDLQLAEIARVLGTKESTVRNHLFNARKTMQKELRRRYPEYASLWKENEA